MQAILKQIATWKQENPFYFYMTGLWKYVLLKNPAKVSWLYSSFLAPYLTDWNNLCAASVLSKRTLMTAAHCLRNHYSFKHPYQILLGTVYIWTVKHWPSLWEQIYQNF
jgi:hypothetical protein